MIHVFVAINPSPLMQQLHRSGIWPSHTLKGGRRSLDVKHDRASEPAIRFIRKTGETLIDWLKKSEVFMDSTPKYHG